VKTLKTLPTILDILFKPLNLLIYVSSS